MRNLSTRPADRILLRPAQSGPALTIVICAYTEDRWYDLRRACRAVRDQMSPPDRLVVVIDHNPALLARARAELGGAMVVANSGRPGLSDARNEGVRRCRTDVVVFLDDDAQPRPGWLSCLRAAFRAEHVCVVGTAVAPRWAGGRRPRWFPDEFGWVVGCSYRGLPVRRAAIRNPIGASMAIRRTVFARTGGFASAVGRVGSLPVGCEETEFCIRMSATQPHAAVLYEPSATVDHLVPATRQKVRYFMRRCYHEGRSKWAVTRMRGAGAALSAERRYTTVVLPRAVLRGAADALRGDLWGLARSGVVLLGLIATIGGYLRGVLSRRSR
jgi:GT2 family glycosyltransferase